MRTAINHSINVNLKTISILKEIRLAYSGKLDFSLKEVGTVLFQPKHVVSLQILSKMNAACYGCKID